MASEPSKLLITEISRALIFFFIVIFFMEECVLECFLAEIFLALTGYNLLNNVFLSVHPLCNQGQ